MHANDKPFTLCYIGLFRSIKQRLQDKKNSQLSIALFSSSFCHPEIVLEEAKPLGTKDNDFPHLF